MTPIFIGFITHVDHRKLIQLVPDEVKKTWDEWALRGLLLISLSSQIILCLLGKIRKYNPRTRIRITLWCNYLLAYAVAAAALGIITRTALDVCSNSPSINSRHKKVNSSELMSFWAPFLLHHIGGPDTITAFASEDNELWLRHFVETAFQSGVALYILLLSWPGCFHLPQLSILVYVSALIKCFERVKALRLANTEHLRDSMLGPADPGPNYPKFLEDLHFKKSQGYTVSVEAIPEPALAPIDHTYAQGSNEISIAYVLFQRFKRLFVDLILTFEDRDISLSYFRHFESGDAFRVVEIELAFAYDMLYTKASVVYTIMGLMLRVTSVFLLFLVPVGFYFLIDMTPHHVVDVAITYLLIGAAILMEIFAVITMLRSDWTDHWLSQRKHTRKSLIFAFLKQPSKQRWSSLIGQLDLLSVALEEKPGRLMAIQKFFGVDNYRVRYRYKTYRNVSVGLRELIYRQFREFMGKNSDPKDLCTHKGSYALRNNHALLWSINEVEFDQSILIWHIATALCYHSEDDEDKDLIGRTESKHISDYLLYLLVSYPAMLPIGIGMIRYRDTCAEAMRFFKEKAPTFSSKSEACTKMLEVDCLEVLPSKVKGDRCKSALFDGCRLALTLRSEIQKGSMWKVVCQVWIEILAYAATHCRGFHHEQQLRKGGEFLTHVWLLMAHLGITEQFQVSQGHARARINVS